MCDLSSLTRNGTHTTYIGRWSLNHRTAGEVPYYFLIGKKNISGKNFQDSHLRRGMTVHFTPTTGQIIGFPGGTVVKNPPANAGDSRHKGSILGLGRSPGVGNGNLLQYSCLDKTMDRGAWWATVHEVTKSQIGLSIHTGGSLCILFVSF